jgi:RND family efflux transporter MFP subunit
MRALRPSTLALASLVSLLAACGKKVDDSATKKPAPTPVKLPLATAVMADTPVQIVLTGLVAAHQRAEVTADTQGKVLNVMVERGMRVKKDSPVVQLDVRSASLGAREAMANLASARAQRELAEEECKRTKSLLEKGAITRSEYDRQIAQCTSALQQVSAAEARTEMMTKSVRDGVARAPFDGIVAERSVSPGEWVAPGRPLFTLVDDDPLHVDLSVPEVAVRAIHDKQQVDVVAVADDPENKKPHSATVTRIGAEIGRSRSLIVEATIEPGSGLIPGMFVEASITIDHKPRPVIPKDAVVKRGRMQHVFRVVKGELVDTIVQLGPSPAPGQVSILQGIEKGDKVVAKVTDDVVDGLAVVE